MRTVWLVALALLAHAASAFSVREGVASESWMGSLNDSALLCDLVLPGTHDAAAFAVDLPVPRALVITQSSSIDEQLARGVRYLDMRVAICAGTTDKLCMFHGDVYLHLNFDSAVDSIKQFLSKNPSESVVMRLQHERSDSIDDFQTFVETNYLTKDSKLWFLSSATTATALTVRDARGKIVLFWSSGSKTSAFGFDYNSVNTRSTYEFDSVGELVDGFQERAEASGDVTGWYENPTSGLVYYTLFGQRWFSPDAIDKTAEKTIARVQTILATTPMKKGIVSMDYPTDELLTTLIGASLDRFPRKTSRHA